MEGFIVKRGSDKIIEKGFNENLVFSNQVKVTKDGWFDQHNQNFYLLLPTENITQENFNNPWEIITCVIINSTSGSVSYRTVIGCVTTYAFPVLQYHSSPNCFYAYYTTNGTSWITIHTNSILQTNTIYYIKMEWTGTAFNLYLSNNKENWNLEDSTDISLPFKINTNSNKGTPSIGRYSSGSYFENGEINIYETSIKANNKIIWGGLDANE